MKNVQGFLLLALTCLSISFPLATLEGGLTLDADPNNLSLRGLADILGGSNQAKNDGNTEKEDDKKSPTSGGADNPTSATNGGKKNAGTATGTPKKVTGEMVVQATDNFAKDANTVSASLNALPGTDDSAMIKSLAQRAFDAESDEDAQRAVLASAAGKSGAESNEKIMKFTPAVLDGLQAMADDPSQESVEKNIPKIEAARNPNILPSITQLSNAALSAMDLPQKQQVFPDTGKGNP